VTTSAAYAMGYLAAHRWRRRLLMTREKPGVLLAVVAGMAASVALQFWLLRRASTASFPPTAVDLVAQLAPLLLPAIALSATFRSPLRLDVADASWLLTAPGGPRVLLARHLFGFPLLQAALGGLGGVLSRSLMSLPAAPAWKVAVVVGGAALIVRVLGMLAHLSALRAPLLTRILALSWAAALAIVAVAGEQAARLTGEGVARRWVVAIIDSEVVEAGWILVPFFAIALLAVVVLCVARGYIEPADDRARQNAELQVSTRRDTTGLETGASWFRSGLRSWSGRAFLTGERALLFRGLAQQRRMQRMFGLELAVELLVMIVLLALAPEMAWLPLAFVLLTIVVTSSFSGIAVELDHHHVWMAPLRPLIALLCAIAVPAATVAASAEVLWFTLLLGGSLGGGTWLVGAVLIPCLGVVIFLAGALGIAIGGRGVLRIPLSVAFGAGGIAPVLFLVFVPTAPAVAAVAVALAGFATTAARVVRRRLWSSTRIDLGGV